MHPIEDDIREKKLNDAKALADLHTLDDWTAANSTEPAPVAVPNPADGGWSVFIRGQEFQGDGADEARANAAAYARAHMKKA